MDFIPKVQKSAYFWHILFNSSAKHQINLWRHANFLKFGFMIYSDLERSSEGGKSLGNHKCYKWWVKWLRNIKFPHFSTKFKAPNFQKYSLVGKKIWNSDSIIDSYHIPENERIFRLSLSNCLILTDSGPYKQKWLVKKHLHINQTQ